jgi:hypothetical protein
MLQSLFHQGSALRRFRNSRVSRENVEALADDAADLLGKLVSFGGGEIGGDTFNADLLDAGLSATPDRT